MRSSASKAGSGGAWVPRRAPRPSATRPPPWPASTSTSTGGSFVDNGGMDTAAGTSSRALYARLLKYVWPYRGALFAGVVAMIIGGLADAALVKLTGPLIDELFVHKNQSLAILLPLALVGVFVVSGLASFTSGYANQWVSNKVILDLRREMFAKVLRLPPAYFDETASATLVTKFTNDVNNIAAASTSVLTVLVRDTVTIAALLA